MRYLLITIFLLCSNIIKCQELDFIVDIDNTQATTIPKILIDDLKNTIQQFFNNRRWTEDDFETQEKIKCQMAITLTKESTVGRYTSTMQLQIIRPIYNTTYETPIITFLDKSFDFEYTQGQSLDFNENIFLNQLVSLLSFYAYTALALDYDSFNKKGGDKFIEKAYNIATIAQNTNVPELAANRGNGWENNIFNNRFALIQNLFNIQFAEFRECLYLYHYKGLDNFLINNETSREAILNSLEKIEIVRKTNPLSITISSFFLAKKDELISIFSKAKDETKFRAIELLKNLDSPNAEKYRTGILNN